MRRSQLPRGNALKVWGATPDSPFSSLLSQAVSAGGYVTLDRDDEDVVALLIEIEEDSPVADATTISATLVRKRNRLAVAGLERHLIKRGAQSIAFVSWRAPECLEGAP